MGGRSTVLRSVCRPGRPVEGTQKTRADSAGPGERMSGKYTFPYILLHSLENYHLQLVFEMSRQRKGTQKPMVTKQLVAFPLITFQRQGGDAGPTQTFGRPTCAPSPCTKFNVSPHRLLATRQGSHVGTRETSAARPPGCHPASPLTLDNLSKVTHSSPPGPGYRTAAPTMVAASRPGPRAPCLLWHR